VLHEGELSWLEAHVAAFAFFGGVPHRLVPDNLTAAILKADRYDPRLNRAYSELARYYGCLVDPARVGHPKDKPRVERSVAYARESFFRGRAFGSLERMRREAAVWAREVAGQRVHGTTGEPPLVAFEQRERAALLPLPAVPWELVRWTQARVQPDCHLSVAGARYSAPYR
jgi:transposase